MAERLGCTVSELLDRISSAELTEWIALYEIRHKEREKAEKEMESKTKPAHRARRR